jgi:hypothetical protein
VAHTGRVYSRRMAGGLVVKPLIAAAVAAALGIGASSTSADPLSCSLTGYTATPGLAAAVAGDTLTMTWDGERSQEVRLRLGIDGGTPTIRDLAIRRKGATWTTLASNVTPEFRVVSGMRRMSNQQMQPLRALGVEITPAVVDRERWEAFWDAPLDIPGITPGARPGGNLPPDLPRSPSEIHRATATYNATGCEVKTNGARLEISFPGLQLGVFSGRLQYSVYKGANLIRQEAVAKTEERAVAYKYDAGLKGLSIDKASRAVWRDTANAWQDYQFGGNKNDREVPLGASNRLLMIERGAAGTIAAFPPPHTFFWAREVATNLGYVWYRKDSDATFSFGIRQAEKDEAHPQYAGNFALYSARPGTWQHMAVYFYASAEAAAATLDPVLAFTHGDRFKALPGYQVMNHHYHMDLGQRLLQAGSLDAEIPDLHALKSLGINIVSQVDSVGFQTQPAGRGGAPESGRGGAPEAGRGAAPGREGGPGGGRGGRGDVLAITAASVEGARRHSDKTFLIMPNQEHYGSPVGGHTDLLFSHPVYWTQGRTAGQPLVEDDAKYGKVYHIGEAGDLMEMAKREDVLISMPHPRTKGSTGFPDAIKDEPYFKDPHYQGVGVRWGMGLDLSEQRFCEHRCQPLLDDMSNWVADLPIPLKYVLSISEVRYQAPGDDIYASSPVSYIKLDQVPPPADVSPVIKTLMRGDYFVTSGEVLIPTWAVQGTGTKRTVVADVEWTFPLEFVEVISGDGKKTDRQIISATDLPAFGKHRFQIPFDATGKKWVRIAVWDSAGNGAMVQPVKLSGMTSN